MSHPPPAPPSPPPLKVRWLGRQAYAPVWRAMQELTDRRDGGSPDQMWLLEHERVFTLGQAGRMEHVLFAGDIPVLPVDRGGQVTYHGPGQLVAYPLLDLRRLGIGVRQLVDGLEQTGIDLLAEHGIQASRRAGAPGLYVDGRKILAIGIRVRRGCCFHGIALNNDLDLEPFARINPCGYRGLKVCSLASLGASLSMAALAQAWTRHFADNFAMSAAAFDDEEPFAPGSCTMPAPGQA